MVLYLAMATRHRNQGTFTIMEMKGELITNDEILVKPFVDIKGHHAWTILQEWLRTYLIPSLLFTFLNGLFISNWPVLYWISVMMLFFFRVSLSPSWPWQVFVTRDSKYVSHKFCCFDLASVVQRMGRTIQCITKL